ncbi:autotransporter outer membrane beta-barrel domain-containing protein [Alphaproteobacteria bacterium]|nr:autotransporter outer membrane beta-barrel domain-containing protein [Alphaproteobacteria bacterium]
MVLKSRLLKSTFIIQFSTSLALAPAWGFGVTGEEADADVAAPVVLTASPPDAESIVINGTQGAEGAALILDDDRAVEIKGAITIRDRESNADDAATYTLNEAVGAKISTPFTGSNLSLKSGLAINISEVLGPQDNDDDNDGIIEGSPAIGVAQRIGLWVDSGITGSLIGEGGFIRIDGNNARGVQIDDAISFNLDLSTAIDNPGIGGILGDNAIAVDINSTIGGYYRQRGNIDVRGENVVGIDIGADITGSLMIETGVNATGYSTIPSGTPGGPQRGGTDYIDDDFDEFSDLQRAANPQERRQSRAALQITANVGQGVIINGPVNRTVTDAEAKAFSCLAENEGCDDDGILEKRRNGEVVTDLKDEPFHYDENRPSLNLGGASVSGARLTSYGESEATLLIAGSIGTANGATRETFLDTTDDDNDDDPTDDNDAANIYNSTREFFFSHGLINRNWIEANGLYDSVSNGGGYAIDRPATGLKLANGATIHGGIFNSGVISALAYNADATAIELLDGTLTDGQRSDDAVILNEGRIQAEIASHTKSYVGVDADSNTATAVKISGNVNFENTTEFALATPAFVNAGTVIATSTHIQLNTATDASNDYEEVTGDNAIALDLAAIESDFNVTQRLRQVDTAVTADVDGNPGDEAIYRGSGDLDIDFNGDGAVDTRDVTTPQIFGDVVFGAGDNVFAVSAGTVSGNIGFGGGDDALSLSNATLDDADNNYTPVTSVRGRISNGSGTDLDITIGERTQLHLVGQEEEAEVLAIDDLIVSGELKITVDGAQLTADTSVLDVTTLTVNNGAKIIPNLTGLITAEATTIKLIGYINEGVELPSDVLPTGADNELAFIYSVALSHDEDANSISATFARKAAADLGLNQTEAASLDTVLSHFSDNKNLESAITEINDVDAFKAAYRQLLPHYGDGTAQQLSGLADMATGAVSQHLQIANAGGRRGGDGWLQQFGDYRKQDSSANGQTVSGNNYAISLGYDLPVYAIDALGLYMQMGFSSVNEKSADINEVKSESISYGAYLADTIGPLHYQLNASYGFVDLESERLINFNGVVDISRADWEATSTAASARLAYPILDTNHLLRLEAGVDYFRLEHDNYAERESVGNGFAMQVRGGESEKTSQFIGLRGGYRAGEGGDGVGIIFEPNYYLGWRTSDDFTPYSATANFVGTPGETFRLESHIEPEDALDVGLGFAAHNDYFAFEFNYRARIADDEETHGGGVSIRLLF